LSDAASGGLKGAMYGEKSGENNILQIVSEITAHEH